MGHQILDLEQLRKPVKSYMSGKRALGNTLRLVGAKRPLMARCLNTSKSLWSDSSAESEHVASSIPWYLRRQEAVQAANKLVEPMPEMPKNSPSKLQPIVEFMIERLGLTDLALVDLRGTTVNNPFGPNAIMIMCSGKSERHLGKAARELLSWLKTENHVSASQEGIVSAQLLRLHQRRLKKKAARKSKYKMTEEFGEDTLESDYEIAYKRNSSWVALDTRVDGIFIHLFSGSKREELRLEEFWRSPENREIHIQTKNADHIGGSRPRIKPNRFERMYKSPTRQMHTSTTVAASTEFETSQNNETLTGLKNHLNELLSIKTAALEDPSIAKSVTPTCSLVQNMINSFPFNASADHWRIKLLFLSELRSLNPEEFELQIFVDHLLYQQACGIPVDKWDVRFVFERIVYDEASGFQESQVNYELLGEWQKHCDKKLELIMQVHDIAYRCTGEKMCTDDALLGLMMRALVSPAKDAFSSAEALKENNPLPSTLIDETTGEQFGRVLIDDRLFPVVDILNTPTSEGDIQHLTKPMTALVITCLINSGLWDMFWRFWTRIVDTTEVEPDLLGLMVSLVARSGSESAITFVVDQHLPNLLLERGSDLVSPELVSALESCLNYIDPHVTGHRSLRAYLATCTENFEVTGSV